jgi:hypothetical protein
MKILNDMKNFCTVSDKNYLHLGLAMHESLSKTECEYTLYYFCVDDETYKVISEYDDERIVPISISKLLETNEDLKVLKGVEACYEAKAVSNLEGIHEANQWQFLYSLSTFSVNYCLKNLNLDHIMYVDADIFFFEDVIHAFNDIGDKSVGVVEHRLLNPNPAGQFNVGIVYFKNDITGLGASDFWLNCMKDPNNEFAAEYSRYGDQKYLELVYEGSKEDAVIIGDTCGHLAPWSLYSHQYDIDNQLIVWKGNGQKLVYWHFSSFIPDFENNTYIVGRRHGITEINIPFIKEKTNLYFNTIKKYKKYLEN